jgi:hypothetical protein
MEEHAYDSVTVNNEKTIFMKWEENDSTLQGIFVHDLTNIIPTSLKLKEEL